MKAIAYQQCLPIAHAESLLDVDLPEPAPGPHDLLVEIRAVAATNHYHRERNHQGLGNKLLYSNAAIASDDAPIHRRRRLGGMLNFYYREAA
jgi:hypothetical protein